MRYKIDIKEVEKNFRFTEPSGSKIGLTHNTGNKIRILPYTAKFKSEGLEFQSVVGEFSRLLSDMQMKETYTRESILQRIVDGVDIEGGDGQTRLKDIITEMFFDKDGKLEIFHPLIFNYIDTPRSEQKSLAKFLYDVLSGTEIKQDVQQNYNEKPDNVLLKLLFESLPPLETKKKEDKKGYAQYVPFIGSIFLEDFRFMLNNNTFFVEHFESFLRYYYFFYVSQLSVKLDAMTYAQLQAPTPLYFTLDWENVSKKRTGYVEGWQRLSKSIAHLFSHANCLEFLNHKEGPMEGPYTYVDLRQIVDEMNEEERQEFSESVDELLVLYQTHITDVSWEEFNGQIPGTSAVEKIQTLFKAIEYQFTAPMSGRKAAHDKYRKWFEEYCKIYFLKRRGPLGYTLNMTQELLIFVTKLCIKEQEKIRLKSLFDEYEARGLFFDRDSKEKIVQLFEKLNLLEKKSDSGDAQYVKSIL